MIRLTKLHVDNYRSLQDFSVDLQPLTILIGRNDAGKSSTLNAIRLLLDDNATSKVDLHDWNRSVPPSRFPRTLSITGQFEDPKRFTLRRKITITKAASTSSVLEIQEGSIWRAMTPVEEKDIPSFYYLRPRTGALQEAFDPDNENNIFTLVRDWMPPSITEEKDLHRLMRGYAPKVTNLMAYTQFFENEIYGALKIAFPSDFNVTLLHPEFRSLADRGRLFVRELSHNAAPKALFRLPLDHHGTGLISVVAMVLTVAVLREYHRQKLSNRPLIVAIEEPEVHLHPRAERTLLDYVRWSSKQQQLIITTHSPLFVDRGQPENVVVLRRASQRDEKDAQKSGGSIKTGNTIAITSTYRENWRTIVDTLGVRLSDALMAGELNLLVEGPTEAILFPAIAEALAGKLRFHFDRVLVVSGQGGALSYTAQVLQGTGNPTLVVVDNDQGGHNILKALKQLDPIVKYIAMPDIKTLPSPYNLLGECEFEDLFDSRELIDVFNEAFNGVPGFELLPISHNEFSQEQQRRLGSGRPFGWIHTVGAIVKQRTSSITLKAMPEDKIVDKRGLAEVAARYIKAGKLSIPSLPYRKFVRLLRCSERVDG